HYTNQGLNGTLHLAPTTVSTANLSATLTPIPPGGGIVTTSLQVNLAQAQGRPVSATVTVPNDNLLLFMLSDFNIQPTRITPGTDSTTLEWNFTAPTTSTVLYVNANGIVKDDLSSGTLSTLVNLYPSPSGINALTLDSQGNILYTSGDRTG